MRAHLAFLAVAAVMFAVAGSASADFIAFNSPSPQSTGNTDWTGTVGLSFTVSSPGIIITKLGTYDSGQDGIANASGILVQIWNETGPAVVTGLSASLTTGNSTLASGSAFRFLNTFTPVLLPAGNYRIAASGYGAGDSHGNTNPTSLPNTVSPAATFDSGGGLISHLVPPFVSSYYAGPAAYPSSPETPGDFYLAGSFEFTAVPEPTTLAACGLGILGLATFRGRRSR